MPELTHFVNLRRVRTGRYETEDGRFTILRVAKYEWLIGLNLRDGTSMPYGTDRKYMTLSDARGRLAQDGC